jgi:hypothetical protein
MASLTPQPWSPDRPKAIQIIGTLLAMILYLLFLRFTVLSHMPSLPPERLSP